MKSRAKKTFSNIFNFSHISHFSKHGKLSQTSGDYKRLPEVLYVFEHKT